jgi:hypothetical protein
MTLKEKILQVANDLEKEAITYPKMKTMDVVNIVLRRLANEYEEEKPKEITKCQYCGLENGNHKLSCPVIKVTMIL